MLLKRWLLSLLLLLWAPLCLADYLDPVLEPAPVAVPAGMSQQEVAKIIVTTAKQRDWTVQQQSPGLVMLRFERESYWALIRVDYDAKSVRYRYADSKGLMYDKGSGTIHHNYNRWVKNLANDCYAEFTAFTLTR
jgi:hypothetical protein